MAPFVQTHPRGPRPYHGRGGVERGRPSRSFHNRFPRPSYIDCITPFIYLDPCHRPRSAKSAYDATRERLRRPRRRAFSSRRMAGSAPEMYSIRTIHLQKRPRPLLRMDEKLGQYTGQRRRHPTWDRPRLALYLGRLPRSPVVVLLPAAERSGLLLASWASSIVSARP